MMMKLGGRLTPWLWPWRASPRHPNARMVEKIRRTSRWFTRGSSSRSGGVTTGDAVPEFDGEHGTGSTRRHGATETPGHVSPLFTCKSINAGIAEVQRRHR